MTNAQRQAIGIDGAIFKIASEEQRIEWAQNNTTARLGLCEEARAWLVAHKAHVGRGPECGEVGTLSITGDIYIYRLRPDYPPTVMRWWFDTDRKIVYQHSTEPTPDKTQIIEISADYATYLQNKPDGECELRPVKEGDECWHLGKWWTAEEDHPANDPEYCGYAWCKIKPTVLRWWFCTVSALVTLADCRPCKDCVEVSAYYAKVLQDKPDGECELRMVKEGDRYWQDGKWCAATCDYQDLGLYDRGYAWCKIKPAAAWADEASALLASIQRDLAKLAEMLAKHKGAK